MPSPVPQNRSLSPTFQRAFAKFEKTLSESQRRQLTAATYDDVLAEIQAIQDQYGEKKRMQNMARLQGFVEAMIEYGKVIEVFLNATTILGYVWGPVKLVLQVASTWIDSLETLLGAYEEISERAPSFLHYQALFEKNPRMRDALELWYCDVLEFHLHAIQFLTRSRWKQLFKSSWKVFNTNFKRILDALARRKDLIESEKTTLAVLEIQNLHDQSDNRFREMWLASVIDKINPPNYYEDQDVTYEGRDDSESGRWILENDKFRAWREATAGSNPLLYIHGIPGAGKSTLASLIINILIEEEAYPVLFFYCRHHQEGKRTFASILRALVAQILPRDEALVLSFYEKYSSCDRMRFESLKILKEVAEEAFSSQQVSYVILDGLDECEQSEAERALSWFISRQRQANQGGGQIRLLCIGQRTDLLQRLLVPGADISLEDQQCHKKDIESYVDQRTSGISRKFNIDSELRMNIIKRVTTVANGMFLYAKVVMENLLDQHTRHDLLSELEPGVFPDGLEAAYGRVVAAIMKCPAKKKRIALQILGWVACATRPLKWRELQATFFIDPGNGTSPYEDRRLIASCKSFCSSLVDIHFGKTREPTEGIIHLVHSTARDYLATTDTIILAIQHAEMGLFCFQYLLSAPFHSAAQESDVQEYANSGYYALHDYAVSNIFDHLRGAYETGIEDHQEVSDKLLLATKQFIKEYGIPHELQEIYQSKDGFPGLAEICCRVPKEPTKRYALFNLEYRTSVIRRILEAARNTEALQDTCRQLLYDQYGPIVFKCPKIWCVDFYRGFPAAAERDRHIARHDCPFLCPDEHCPLHGVGFDTEASLNKHLTRYHSLAGDIAFPRPQVSKLETLCGAAERGDLDLVQKYIDRGENLNQPSRPKGYQTPLYLAARNGHLAVCDLLWQNGANVDYISSIANSKTALAAAVENEKEDTVRFLLNVTRADPCPKNPSFFPLLLPAATKNIEILKMLLIACRGRCDQDQLDIALSAGSRGGLDQEVRLLIESSTDGSRRGEFVLFKYCEENDVAIVKTLLRANVNPNSRLKDTFTALHVAAQNGHSEIVQALIEGNADPNALSGKGTTSLHIAAESGHAKVVQALIAANADVNTRSREGETALHFALLKGHVAIAQALLEAKADPNMIFTTGETPLHMAAQSGYVEIVQALIKANTDLNTRSGAGETPVHIAAKSGHVQIVQALINANADVNIISMMGETPLNLAALAGHAKTMQALIEANADPTITLNMEETVLEYAAKNGYTGMFEALIRSGKMRSNTWSDAHRSALFLAGKNNHTAVVEKLSRFCPKPDLQFLSSAAKFWGNDSFAVLLTNSQLAIEEVAYRAAYEGNVELVNILPTKGPIRPYAIKYGEKIPASDHGDIYLRSSAVRRGQEQLLDWYAAFNANSPRALDVELMHTFVAPGNVSCVKISSDGQYLAASGNDEVGIYSLYAGRYVGSISTHDGVPSGIYIRPVCFSSSGAHVAAGGGDEKILVRDIAKGAVTSFQTTHTAKISAVHYNASEDQIISASYDKTICAWDLSNGNQLLYTLYTKDQITSLAISPNGQYLAAGDPNGDIYIWKITDRTEPQPMHGYSHKGRIDSISFTSDSLHLRSFSLDKVVKDCNVQTGFVHNICEQSEYVSCIGLSNDYRWLISSTFAGDVRIQDLLTMDIHLILRAHHQAISSLAFSPTDFILVTGSRNSGVRVWKFSQYQVA